jgi:hypothetical protein
VVLEPVKVTAPLDRRMSGDRTGPEETISEQTISRLPLLGRDFSQLAFLSPLVTQSPGGGLSFAGQPDRLNGFQVDGATNNDLFGGLDFAPGIGTVGSIAGARTLSAEALKEIQIITAPFDVRYGNFAAGLVNAVTKSGTNHFTGTMYGYFQNDQLSGRDTLGTHGEDFFSGEAGVNVGGALVPSRLLFFLDMGARRTVLPNHDPRVGADTTGTGFRLADVARFREILQRTQGFDVGDAVPYPTRNPSRSLFVKLTAPLQVNQRLELSHNYVFADNELWGSYVEPFYRLLLSSKGLSTPSTTNATRLTWTSLFRGSYSSELTVARLKERSECIAASSFATVNVRVDGGLLRGGSQAGCPGAYQDQEIVELTENTTRTMGRHRVTVGTHDELIRLPGRNGFDYQFNGEWTFNDFESLERGAPAVYAARVRGPATGNGPLSNLQVRQFGLYTQDQWVVTINLLVTAGLRLELPLLPTPPRYNAALDSALGVNTSTTPSGRAVWSPRVGFNYDPSGTALTFVRGGVGLFEGRPAYKWFNGVYVHTGLEQLLLRCTGSAVPKLTLVLDALPTSCNGVAGTAVPNVVVFDRRFRFPQYLKASLGIDRQLPWNVVGSFDVLYTRGVNQFYLNDLNLVPNGRTAAGEGGRVMYGTVDPESGTPVPNRRSTLFGSVVEMTNARGDETFAVSPRVHRQFGAGAEVDLAYTFTRSTDRLSSTEPWVAWDLGFTPLQGTLANRTLATSTWSVPHKVTALATVNLPFRTRLAMQYIGASGAPFTYTVQGDANADGIDVSTAGAEQYFGGLPNDIMYVPRDSVDITLATPSDWKVLNELIDDERCLRTQRARMMHRNSCRNPWTHLANARLSRPIALRPGRTLDLMLDVFNVLNLLNARWGLVRRTTDYSLNYHAVTPLQLVGYDTARDRGVYSLVPVQRDRIDPDAGRWRVQIGARLAYY